MSRCSSSVLRVNGPRRIGRGRQHVRQARDRDDVRRMAAAGAFGVEGVDGAALERLDRVFDEAGFVQRVRVDHHLHVVIVGDRQRSSRWRPASCPSPRAVSARRRRLRPARPVPPAARRCALPAKPRFIGKASAASIMRAMCHGPGVQVVANVPVAGPVPPPSMEVTPLISASSICCGQMKWICVSKPPAVRILPSPAMISVPGPMMMSTPGWMSGLPALPIAAICPSRMRDVGLHDAPMIENDGVGDDRIGRAIRASNLATGPCRRG